MKVASLLMESGIIPTPGTAPSTSNVGGMVILSSLWFDPVHLASSGTLMPSRVGPRSWSFVQLVSRPAIFRVIFSSKRHTEPNLNCYPVMVQFSCELLHTKWRTVSLTDMHIAMLLLTIFGYTVFGFKNRVSKTRIWLIKWLLVLCVHPWTPE